MKQIEIEIINGEAKIVQKPLGVAIVISSDKIEYGENCNVMIIGENCAIEKNEDGTLTNYVL